MEQSTNAEYLSESEPSHLFDDVADTAPYEKSLKRARVWLYIIAGAQFIMGIVEFSNATTQTVGAIAFAIDALMAGIFLSLALWSRKKPAIAFLSAIIFYSVFIASFAVIDMANLYRGVIVKIIVFVALIRAYNDARKYEEIKRSTGY